MAIVTKHQSFIASVEISIPEDSDFVRNAALEIVLPDTLKKFDHPLGLEQLHRSMEVSNFGNFVLVHFAVPEGMTAEHINEGAQILRSNFVADLSDYLLGHAMKDIENVRIANGLHRSFPFSGCERQETPMSKAFVEGFGFEMIAKHLEKVLNDYGFACEVAFLGSKSEGKHDGRSIVVRALPNSLVHAVLRYPHLVESEHVHARLTPEQAILALGYIDGTSVESDDNYRDAALNVNHLAYYLHKCSKTTIVREPSRYEDLTAAEQAESMPNTPIRK